jgi:peptidoglycan hydrolase-like protein with peptidoglycan-binding domain
LPRNINVARNDGANMKLLKLNDSGIEVRRLQELLVKQGFVLSIDGIFGSKTESAVKALQSKNGITNDGIVGIKTMAILEKNSGKEKEIATQQVARNDEPKNNIKTFSLKIDGETQLTSNFKVREFACKDGSDKILIDTELVKHY